MTAIEPVLDRAVAQLAAAHPESEIETDFEFDIPVCDANRLAPAMAIDCGRSDDIA